MDLAPLSSSKTHYYYFIDLTWKSHYITPGTPPLISCQWCLRSHLMASQSWWWSILPWRIATIYIHCTSLIPDIWCTTRENNIESKQKTKKKLESSGNYISPQPFVEDGQYPKNCDCDNFHVTSPGLQLDLLLLWLTGRHVSSRAFTLRLKMQSAQIWTSHQPSKIPIWLTGVSSQVSLSVPPNKCSNTTCLFVFLCEFHFLWLQKSPQIIWFLLEHGYGTVLHWKFRTKRHTVAD
jgi:hypothetical protein